VDGCPARSAASAQTVVHDLAVTYFSTETLSSAKQVPVEHDARSDAGSHVDPDERAIALRSSDSSLGNGARVRDVVDHDGNLQTIVEDLAQRDIFPA
jgi:hypothetical protein